MLGVSDGHDFWVLLNSNYSEASLAIRQTLQGLLPASQIIEFQAGVNKSWSDPGGSDARRVARALRELMIWQINPDVIHIASLFEDQGVVSLDDPRLAAKTVVTLYDLIPLINSDIYLENKQLRSWYYNCLADLKRAGKILAISESSRREAIAHLGLSVDRVDTISGAAGSEFVQKVLSVDRMRELREKYYLNKKIVMYTGGIDHRKNISSLIEAYASLPKAVRDHHQLAIICSIREEDGVRLRAAAAEFGLTNEQVIFTGYVPQQDLVDLYNLCVLFVFPSWHEGFGLPVLEAMACGAAVISANNSSLPELVGMADAMFDPHNVAEISDKMHSGLTDVDFSNQLKANGRVRAKLFCWTAVAVRALDAMEALVVENASSGECPQLSSSQTIRPSLAYVSPMPPARSGVAVFAHYLLKELLAFYRITVVTPAPQINSEWVRGCCDVISPEQFLDTAECYDRVLYQMGNSEFHVHMVEMLESVRGVVVMHDCYLSGMFNYLEWTSCPGAFTRAMFRSHSYEGLWQDQNAGRDVAIEKYTCNQSIKDRARLIVVHSQHAAELVHDGANPPVVMPLIMPPVTVVAREQALRALGLPDGAVVVATFGSVDKNKCSLELLQAWLRSSQSRASNVYLIYVGDDRSSPYGHELRKKIKCCSAAGRVIVTGHVDDEKYLQYLSAATCAVQLRVNSRGETSAAVLECLAAGLPLVINEHGSAAEIPSDIVLRLPEQPTRAELSDALDQLLGNQGQRPVLAAKGRQYVTEKHNPAKVAREFMHQLEGAYQQGADQSYDQLVKLLGKIKSRERSENALPWLSIAQDIAVTQGAGGRSQCLVDITPYFINRQVLSSEYREALVTHLLCPSQHRTAELVYEKDGMFWYAREFAGELLGLDNIPVPDQLLQGTADDKWCSVESLLLKIPARAG